MQCMYMEQSNTYIQIKKKKKDSPGFSTHFNFLFLAPFPSVPEMWESLTLGTGLSRHSFLEFS